MLSGVRNEYAVRDNVLFSLPLAREDPERNISVMIVLVLVVLAVILSVLSRPSSSLPPALLPHASARDVVPVRYLPRFEPSPSY